ncbi:f-box/lrr-repeat protein [Quercus suber]|uniref:F-box/lrr-repeat protein n=1 Tax=Quercus suber TaxID=58331 RepID=A0AAW0LGI4_QUESU
MTIPIPITPLFSPITPPPTTQQTLTLPHSLTSETETDTTLCAETHFGFDPLTNTHKVLRVEWTVAIPESNPRVSQMVCTVFTLGCRSIGSWRRAKINPELPFHSTKCMSSGKSVCINGAIHWVTQFGNYIVAFDLKDENFRLIPLPHKYKAENFKPLHFEFNRLIELDYKYSGDRFRDDEYICHFWILKDYHNHVWVEEKISVPFDFRANFYGKHIPIGTIHMGEILLEPFSWFVLFKDYLTCLLFYDMEGQGFKKVDVTGLPKWVYDGCHLIIRTISVYEGASKSIFA